MIKFFSPTLVCALTLALISLALPTKADFDLAMQYYQQSLFEKAYNEFLEAAAYGQYSAHYNLGVMYYRGEFVEKDIAISYAWFALAAQDKDYKEKDIHNKLYNNLSADRKKDADEIYIQLLAQYGDKTLENRLTPVLADASPLTKRLRIIKTVVPNYPQSMAKRGLMGWADMFFTVDKDGTTRDHVVYHATYKSFGDAATEAVRAWQYEPMKINGEAVAVNGVKRRFIFRLEGFTFSEQKIKKLMAELEQKAINGDGGDKLQYAYFLDALPSYTSDYKATDNPNAWYMAAANNGSSAASFFLGQNILYGNMCTADADKSLGWLIKAASQHVTDAQYTLALELLSGARLKKNEAKALYWLVRAANSNPAAQLRYAWILATHPDKNQRNGTLAAKYLEKIPQDYRDKQTHYQVAAVVAAENGNFKSAIVWQKKALKDARKLGLPEQQINDRLAAYQNKKSWQEPL